MWQLLLIVLLAATGWMQVTDEDLVAGVETALMGVPGVEVSAVTLDAGTLQIDYVTKEVDEIGYRAEMLEAYRAVGEYLMQADNPVTQVTLVSNVSTGEGLEQIETASGHVLALASGDITRSAFLETLTITELEHSDPANGSGGNI
ncbi:MAG: hypothetical protein K8L99_17640 [Anaerolineae bacterium]|nr:hypothetical protein [Anaerolineae bacterium]